MRIRAHAWVAGLFTLAACSGATQEAATVSAGGSLAEVMKQRELTDRDITAAARTYTPSGERDDYLMFASGGHSGQVIVIGMPSMRILKYIGVFTPEPWQGYGYDDETRKLLRSGDRDGRPLNWGDTHHPALSETAGDYDGDFLFINDKANARIAVINLKDFVTTQIVSSGLIVSDHGGTFVTPNTEYVIEGSQYPAPLGGGYADIAEYDERYRGAVIFWKFDRERGRIDEAASFAMELPPYMQDLSDAGKGPSEGWVFLNSFNTERATGGNAEGKPPLESGASQNDMDYMHVIHLDRAKEVVDEGKTETIAGMRTIRLATAVQEGLLYFVGEPKSPHGVDVAPNGEDIVVSGKLDTHVTVYSFSKIKALIEQRKFDGTDPYDVPILPFQDAVRGQCEVGLGPLHTQYDADGNAYTSLFLESKVARWSLADLELKDKVAVHYNVGHIATAEGDTVSPDGKFLVAMNKWALDRFNDVGPLLPQNFQLVDVSDPTRMTLLYDLPIPLGEPHYAQIIEAAKVDAIRVYDEVGTNAISHELAEHAVEPGSERVERTGEHEVHVYMTAVRSHFTPDTVRVREGDTVHFHVTNVEQAHDATHGFTVGLYDVHMSLEPGKHADASIVVDRPGVFPLYCTEFCSALHLEMAGYLLVEPAGGTAAGAGTTDG